MRDILIPGSRGGFRGRIQRRRTLVVHVHVHAHVHVPYMSEAWGACTVQATVRRMLGTVVLGRLEVCCVSELSGEGTCRRATCCGGFNSYSFPLISTSL
jgi:hypothetical protein